MQLIFALFAAFLCLVNCQQDVPEDNSGSMIPRICSKKEFEKLFTGNATKVFTGLGDVFDQNVVIRLLNKTLTRDQMTDYLQRADFKSFVSILEKPVLIKDDMCWIDLVGVATMKDSDCIIGGRRVIQLRIKEEKISRWDEVFFPLNFSHLCGPADYAKLPQDLFGSKQDSGKISGEKIELPRNKPAAREAKPIERSERSSRVSETAGAANASQPATNTTVINTTQPANATVPAANASQPATNITVINTTQPANATVPAANASQPANASVAQPVVNKTVINGTQ